MNPLEREAGLPGDNKFTGPVAMTLLAAGIALWLKLPSNAEPSAEKRLAEPTPAKVPEAKPLPKAVEGGRGQAATEVRNIVNALKSYYNDYGKFPPIVKALPKNRKWICVGDPACTNSVGPNSLLFDVLRSIPRGANANHVLNRRQVKYIEAPAAKDTKEPRGGFADGPEYPEAIRGCLLDPWGHQYCIIFDIDGSETLDLSAVYSDLAGPEQLLRYPIVAFSLGKGGVLGSKEHPGCLRSPSGEPSDDIGSWQ